MAKDTFSIGDFLVRWLGAFALVVLTFNPTPYSYLRWLLAGWGADGLGDDLPLKALAGVVLLILYVIFLRSTFRSIGALGVILTALLLGAILWVLIDWGWLDPHGGNLMVWIVLGIIATILAVGLSWSHVRRRLTGQVDVDDIEEG